MDIQQASQEIQRMHETETLRRESIIAWYSLYANKLPSMQPERSDVDLIRTIAIWMELTDRGGSPGFPYDYKSALSFPTINPAEPAKPSVMWLFGAVAFVAGIVTLFFNWKIGLALIVAGPLIIFVAYKLSGGTTNPNLMKQGSSLYEREGRRVLDWAAQQRSGHIGHITNECC